MDVLLSSRATKGTTITNSLQRRNVSLVFAINSGKLHRFRGLMDPHVAVHGSFSVMVNYHAIGLYCTSRSGFVLHDPQEEASLKVSVLVFTGGDTESPSACVTSDPSVSFADLDSNALTWTGNEVERLSAVYFGVFVKRALDSLNIVRHVRLHFLISVGHFTTRSSRLALTTFSSCRRVLRKTRSDLHSRRWLHFSSEFSPMQTASFCKSKSI